MPRKKGSSFFNGKPDKYSQLELNNVASEQANLPSNKTTIQDSQSVISLNELLPLQKQLEENLAKRPGNSQQSREINKEYEALREKIVQVVNRFKPDEDIKNILDRNYTPKESIDLLIDKKIGETSDIEQTNIPKSPGGVEMD